MKSTITNKIIIIVSFIASVLTIIDHINGNLMIEISKILFLKSMIGFEYLYANYRVYTLILSLFIFFISLFVGYKTKKYNAKIAKKYEEIIIFFKVTLLTKEELDYKRLSCLIKEIYPYKNKSKINLVFTRFNDDVVLYDTSNYNEWRHKRLSKFLRSNKLLYKRCYDSKATSKYFEKRVMYVFLGDGQDKDVLLKIYSNSKAVVTNRKKKMIKPFLDSIEIFMYAILIQQNG